MTCFEVKKLNFYTVVAATVFFIGYKLYCFHAISRLLPSNEDRLAELPCLDRLRQS